jgi:hypothetical protein
MLHLPTRAAVTRRRRKGRIIVFDSASRADSAVALGNAETGQPWTALRGTWGTQGGRIYLAVSSGANDVAAVNAGVSDGIVSCLVTGLGGAATSDWRLAANITDADNYFVLVASVGTNYTLYRVQVGGFTGIGTVAVLPAVGDLASIERRGPSLIARVNAVSSGLITDAFNQGATRHGLASGGAVSAARYDNFSVAA